MRGKPGNEVNTTATLAYYIYCCHIARYDFANAILYFDYCQYSDQLASQTSKFVSIRVHVYCSILYYRALYKVHYYVCIPLLFVQRKTLYISCVQDRIFLKSGSQRHYCPPSSTFWGTMALWPPCGGPHVFK